MTSWQRAARVLVLALIVTACGTARPGAEPPSPSSSTPGVAIPIEAPAETWTWVDFPDSACGNGEPTGIGVNLTPRSSDLLVFFDGGGACWDFVTCFGLKTAINIESGYTAQSFANETLVLQNPLWDRADLTNPFRDANFVFIPYCTGDVFSGDAVRSYDPLDPTRKVHHVGARNVELFLARLAVTVPNAAHVWLSGSSAGGYGVQVHFPRFASAFARAEIHALADSSPALQPQDGLYELWKAAWNIQAPPGCEGRGPNGTTVSCLESLPAVVDFLAERYPSSRFGLLEYSDDPVIRGFFGYFQPDASFTDDLFALLRDKYDTHANTKYFIFPGAGHALLKDVATLTGPGGVTLSSWVRAWATGTDWVSVK